MLLGINQRQVDGRLTSDPKTDVVGLESGRKTVVTFDLAHDHPHDSKKPVGKKRTQFVHVRAWGRSAEAYARYLRKGDHVLIVDAIVVQDHWVDRNDVHRFKDFVEPRPYGLKYVDVAKFKKEREDGNPDAV